MLVLLISFISRSNCKSFNLANCSILVLLFFVQDFGEKLNSLLEENNMLYLQSNRLLKDCALEEIEEALDVNSNEDIQKFKRQTSRGKPEVQFISPFEWGGGEDFYDHFGVSMKFNVKSDLNY